MGENKLRIAIDAQILPRQGGVGEYTVQLVRELLRQGRHNYILFTNPLTRQRLGSDLRRAAAIVESESSPVAPRWLFLTLPGLLKRLEPDIYHSPVFLLPASRSCPCVATVHDMIFRLFPKTMPWKRRLYWNYMMRGVWQRAARIMADSACTRDDIARLTWFPPQRIDVVPLAADDRFTADPEANESRDLRGRYRLPEKYFLSVGTLEPRKNLTLSLQALAQYRRAGGRVPLLVAGPRGWLEKPVFQEIKRLGLEDMVKFAGEVPFQDLPALYRQALALVFPSLYEGFGLPVLEAMACGTPVIASRFGAVPEVAGEAAQYIDPYSAEGLAACLKRISGDAAVSASLRAAGKERVRSFSWQRTAELTAAVYERTVTGPGGK